MVANYREFKDANEAFAYAATLDNGVVLDWGRCYAAMEHKRLNTDFVGGEWEQPVVTPLDFKVRPIAPYLLARRIAEGGCCTNFSDESKSWSECVYEVIEDGNGTWPKGTRLRTRLVPNESARPSVGRNWRMKLLRPEDVMAILPSDDGDNHAKD